MSRKQWGHGFYTGVENSQKHEDNLRLARLKRHRDSLLISAQALLASLSDHIMAGESCVVTQSINFYDDYVQGKLSLVETLLKQASSFQEGNDWRLE